MGDTRGRGTGWCESGRASRLTGMANLAVAGAAVLRRPDLWRTAARQGVRLTNGWTRRRPFLPVPPRDYLAFRAVTQYGDASHRPEAHDVVGYLEWCRRMDALRRAS
ncbi:MAG: hypothetical protein R2705_04150 [Ilumatobacteraceae bacterium]